MAPSEVDVIVHCLMGNVRPKQILA